MVLSMETTKFSVQSVDRAAKAGIVIPTALPLLETSLRVRSQGEAAARLFCLHAVVAASYGFDNVRALEWLRREGLDALLVDAELSFLQSGNGNPQVFQTQVECMWALAWALSLVGQMDFWTDCDDRFVTLMPNLKVGERIAETQRKLRLRRDDDLVSACDLAYCLHWAVRQAALEGKQPPARLKAHVVVERRRALEWLLSDERWDAVSLDT